MVIPHDHRPASVWILRVQQQALSTISDGRGLSPEHQQGIAGRLHCSLRRGCERWPTSARKLPIDKRGGQGAKDQQ